MADLPKIHSFFAAIQFQARLNPHALAIASESQSLTYAKFCAAIERVTRRLVSLGLPTEGRVSIQVEIRKRLAASSCPRAPPGPPRRR